MSTQNSNTTQRIHSNDLGRHGRLCSVDETLSAQVISADGQILIDVSHRLPINHRQSVFHSKHLYKTYLDTQESDSYLQASLYPLMMEVG